MIRILHTADWHLGREFHGRDLTSLHEHFFDWLVNEVEVREIDVLLLAGDIYDRALPPVGAIDLLNRRLEELCRHTRVIAITGNHDSVARMSHGRLLRPDICLRAGTSRLGEPVVHDDGDFPLAVYPIPYLDPPTTGGKLGLDRADHELVLAEAVRRSRDDLAGRPGTRAIAVAHAFITGAETSESERDIQVGGSQSVPSSLFDGFDYVALGHLHRPQSAGANHIRYSGSPIPLSFSEVGIGEPKSVSVIELSPDGTTSVEAVEIPQAVTMRRVRGTLDELLTSDEWDGLEDAWLEVTLTDEVRPDQPKDRLRSRFGNVVSLHVEAPLIMDGDGPDAAAIERLDDRQVVESFIEHVRGEDRGASESERELLDRAFAERTAREVRA